MSHEDEVRSETTNDPYESNEDTTTWAPWGWTWRPDVDDESETHDAADSRWGSSPFVLLVLVGVVLFVFPEPAPSALGVFFLLVGGIGLLANVFR